MLNFQVFVCLKAGLYLLKLTKELYAERTSIFEHFVDFSHRLDILVHVLNRLWVHFCHLVHILTMHECNMQHVSLSLLPISLCIFAIHNHMDQVTLNVTNPRRIVQGCSNLHRCQKLNIIDVSDYWNASLQELVDGYPGKLKCKSKHVTSKYFSVEILVLSVHE